MMTCKNAAGDLFDKDVNRYLNFHLTKERAKLAKLVRQARKEKKIHKYYINQNGVIKIKRTSADIYTEVKSEAHLFFN